MKIRYILFAATVSIICSNLANASSNPIPIECGDRVEIIQKKDPGYNKLAEVLKNFALNDARKNSALPKEFEQARKRACEGVGR